METIDILRDLAIILLFAKCLGILARKFKAPQVVGQILAGLLVGPCVFGWISQSDFITQMAEVGVIILMFSVGLESDLKELLKTGPIAFLIACAGVLTPLIAGALLYMGFYGVAPWGSENFYKAVFIGTIMTATSVSITVASLQELGKIKSKVGTTIVSAAIIDDVIGIIVLTFVVGFKNPDSNSGMVVLKTIAFFAVAIVGGFLIYRIFLTLDKRYPHTRRIPIVSVAFCFGLSYIAERYFGIADITGAYVAGLVLCSLSDNEYIERKIDVSSYMFFGPIFFASIGLKTSFDSINGKMIAFCICFVIVALLSKVIGCGLVSRVCKYNVADSLKIGVGMMTRGEVALIVAQKGLAAGMLTADYFTAVILLIIVSSILTPIILKVLYSRDDKKGIVQA
ncbi:cation:proton antiporter [Parablautia intestinalis]|jgi:Kef-type K+ transport system membrane component KefB|uniref:Cation:proton antiporter n=1 Tax=Parablautia intestinalis TaxID=2320100 RepID=A0A3A9AKI6_9FIRM|nr:cation:proton antiporter [Parablautia intestinalis]MCI8613540.1 cation:proton antiporter [Lachnospiraceae bacterium]MDE7048445.1 cation:proton antiporter [Lachnospiraceae bacterium]RKI91494.1 cation:proton antiporter [Parablautia intestinalis]